MQFQHLSEVPAAICFLDGGRKLYIIRSFETQGTVLFGTTPGIHSCEKKVKLLIIVLNQCCRNNQRYLLASKRSVTVAFRSEKHISCMLHLIIMYSVLSNWLVQCNRAGSCR